MLYIHIPFCKQKCIYCDFYSVAQQSLLSQYLDAICTELSLRHSPFSHSPLRSIYLGGGTPSLLSAADLSRLFHEIHSHFHFAPDIEITMETNPEHLTENYLNDLKSYTPINRLSIGIQTFDDVQLRQLNRRHSGNDAIQAIEMAQTSGFENISIDLMYGLPDQTLQQWQSNLQTTFRCGVQHLSAYCLTISPKTMLHRLVEQHKISIPNEELAAQQQELFYSIGEEYGFHAYEISNSCRVGYESKHNSGYWDFRPYLGIGASAHSFVPNKRQWNVSDLKVYLSAIANGNLPLEEEELDAHDHFNEQVFLGLRLARGIYLPAIASEYRSALLQKSARYISEGFLLHCPPFLSLSPQGKLLADRIAMELFVCQNDNDGETVSSV